MPAVKVVRITHNYSCIPEDWSSSEALNLPFYLQSTEYYPAVVTASAGMESVRMDKSIGLTKRSKAAEENTLPIHVSVSWPDFGNETKSTNWRV